MENVEDRVGCIVANSKMAAYLLEQAPSQGYDPEKMKKIIVVCEAFGDNVAYALDYEDLCKFIEDHGICFEKPKKEESDDPIKLI